MGQKERDRAREQTALEDQRRLSSSELGWGGEPPGGKSTVGFERADWAAEAAGWAFLIGWALWVAGPDWSPLSLLWQAPLGLLGARSARLSARATILGALADGPALGAKAGAAMAARCALRALGLALILTLALPLTLLDEFWPKGGRVGALLDRLAKTLSGRRAARDANGLNAGLELQMARRLGPAFSWSLASRWAAEGADEGDLWALWRSAPFDPSWPVSSSWGDYVGLPRLALSFVFGPRLRAARGLAPRDGGETLLSLAIKAKERLEGVGPPPSRDAVAPDPKALQAALDRERISRSTGPGASAARRGLPGAL